MSKKSAKKVGGKAVASRSVKRAVAVKTAKPTKKATKPVTRKAAKRTTKPVSHKPARAASSDRKLDTLIKQQARILQGEHSLAKREERIAHEERRIEDLAKREVKLEQEALAGQRTVQASETAEQTELQKLESLERDVKAQVMPHPLTRVTMRDFAKGIVGAFVGVVVHFTFTYGVEIAESISMQRAAILYVITFFIGAAFLYATGFRKISDNRVYWLLPWRIIVLYATALLVTVGTLGFFYPTNFVEPGLLFRDIAVINLSAVIGACTADLIGRE